jgi:outer membrane protein TolC
MTKYTSITTAILCVSAFLLHAVCLAEELPAKLTASDAVTIALRANAKLKGSHAGYLDAASQLKIDKLRTTSDLTSNLSLERREGESDTSNLVTGTWTFHNPAGAEATLDVSPYGSGSSRGGLGIELRRPLGSRSGRFSDKADLIQSAQASASTQYKDLFLTKQSVTQNVVDSYYQAVLAREQVTVVEGALTLARQGAEDARKRLKEELVAEIDVSKADILVAQTEDELNQQRQAARSAVDQLMIAMGLGVGQNPELVDPVPEPAIQSVTLDEAIKAALANRTELAQYDISIAEQQRRVALRGDRMRPKLDVVAGLDTRNTDTGLLSSSITDYSTLTAGIEYHVPLDSRSLAADRESAARALETTKANRDLQAETIAQEIRSAFRTMEESKATLEIYTENLKVADKSLFLATRMFEEGLRDNRNVLDAQQNVAQAKNNILAAKTKLYLAGLNLRYAMGEDIAATEAK